MKRPLAVTILGCLFIAVGTLGLLYHSTEKPRDLSIILISSVRLLAIVGGIFLIKGRNWARWLVLAWMALHIGISAFDSLSQTIAHAVLLLVIGYFLLTPPASKYFQTPATP
jgi:hypothetical protein